MYKKSIQTYSLLLGKGLPSNNERLQAIQVCSSMMVGARAGIILQDVVHDDLIVGNA